MQRGQAVLWCVHLVPPSPPCPHAWDGGTDIGVNQGGGEGNENQGRQYATGLKCGAQHRQVGVGQREKTIGDEHKKRHIHRQPQRLEANRIVYKRGLDDTRGAAGPERGKGVATAYKSPSPKQLLTAVSPQGAHGVSVQCRDGRW